MNAKSGTRFRQNDEKSLKIFLNHTSNLSFEIYWIYEIKLFIVSVYRSTGTLFSMELESLLKLGNDHTFLVEKLLFCMRRTLQTKNPSVIVKALTRKLGRVSSAVDRAVLISLQFSQRVSLNYWNADKTARNRLVDSSVCSFPSSFLPV